jgi:hypothetical protein
VFRVTSPATDRKSQLKRYYEVPSLEVSQYVRRSELLRKIKVPFSNTTDGAPWPKRVVLLGMGGQGKHSLPSSIAAC